MLASHLRRGREVEVVHVAQLKGLLAASDLHDRALVQESRDHFLELEIEHERRR